MFTPNLHIFVLYQCTQDSHRFCLIEEKSFHPHGSCLGGSVSYDQTLILDLFSSNSEILQGVASYRGQIRIRTLCEVKQRSWAPCRVTPCHPAAHCSQSTTDFTPQTRSFNAAAQSAPSTRCYTEPEAKVVSHQQFALPAHAQELHRTYTGSQAPNLCDTG